MNPSVHLLLIWQPQQSEQQTSIEIMLNVAAKTVNEMKPGNG
jgi:hypothetical protein